MTMQRGSCSLFEDDLMFRKLLACALLAAAGPAFANDGLLDSSFGIFSTGRNLVAIDQGGTNSDQLADTLVAADGSIFLIGTSRGAGTVTRFSISKLSRDGILDLSFGTNGTVLSGFSNLTATRAKFDAVGNILIAGSSLASGVDRDFAVCRYDQQGQPVIFSALLSPCAITAIDWPGGNLTDVANDVIVSPDGKIILAGVAGISATRSRAATVRLLPTGLRDQTFGTDGKSTVEPSTGFINQFNAIARRPDGKYIAVGEYGDASSAQGIDSLFVRLTTNGSLDTSYENGSGYSNYRQELGPAFVRYDAATRIEILGNGKMLMAGKSQTGQNSDQYFVYVNRINPTDVKNFDVTFGTGAGIREFAVNYSFDLGDMFLQSDGKILLVGTHRATSAATRKLVIMRLTADGLADPSFGASNNARTYLDFNVPGNQDFGIAGALQNGRIIVAGYSLNTAPLNYDLIVAGLNNDLIFADNFDGQ
jgi:uncharacterized delta-60 repeat protein